MNDRDPNHFFASQNTCEGFRCYFDTVFSQDSLKELWIVKGGPGTGKSHLMRSLARTWQEQGHRVELFACSSDPSSLDGVLRPDDNVAVIDGTPPHAAEALYPGCVTNLLNTGAFWDRQALAAQAPLLRQLTREKARATERAYAFLRALGHLQEEQTRLASLDLQEDKLNRAAQRFVAKELKGLRPGSRQVRLISTWNKFGLMRLDTLEQLARRRCLVCDRYRTGYLFLNRLLAAVDATVWVAYAPGKEPRPEALYYPQSGLCVVCAEKKEWEDGFGSADRYVNMERFLCPESLREHRQKLRFGQKCIQSLEEGAREAFGRAAGLHAQLEEGYTRAMDLTALAQWENGLCQRI